MAEGGALTTTELQQRPVVLADELTTAPEGKRLQDPGRLAVFVVGALLLALFVIGVVIAQTDGTKTNKATPSTLTTNRSETTGGGNSKDPPRATKTTSTSKTAAGASAETTKSAPSEGLLLAVLGTGVILVLVGALYTRITTIKLPGGAELTLSAEESKTVAEAVAEKASPHASQPEVAQATSAALLLAQTRKQVGNEPLNKQAIEHIATAGLHAAGVTPAEVADGGPEAMADEAPEKVVDYVSEEVADDGSEAATDL